MLETRLIAEHCWQYNCELWVADDDKRHAFDSPQVQGGMDVAMDRLGIPWQLVALTVKAGAHSNMMLRTAHGLAASFNRQQGTVQGGEDSPQQWVFFEDPFCTRMELLEMDDDASPLKLTVPFCPTVRVTGKSLADDKRYIAPSHQGIMSRFRESEAFDGFHEIERKPPKCGVQALVQTDSRTGFKAKAELPKVQVYNHRLDRLQDIPMHEADDPMRTLGYLSTVALSDGYAVRDAREAADRVAVCIKSGVVLQQLWLNLLNAVAEARVRYKMMVTTVGRDDFKDIQGRCYLVLKARAGLCSKTSDDAISALVQLEWWHLHCLDQLMLILRYLSRADQKVYSLLRLSMVQHTLWQAGEQQGLAGPLNPNRGWDSTLIGRLHSWMTEMSLSITGPTLLPLGPLGTLSSLIWLMTPLRRR